MKRTAMKFKSKGIKGSYLTHRPKVKYDRNFVINHYADVTHLPFSRTSACEKGRREDKCLTRYLKRWLKKQVEKSVDDVFHDFNNLGWNNTCDMYYYWERYVHINDQWWDYYADENGCLTEWTRDKIETSPEEEDEDEDGEEFKHKAKRPKASDKRLTRKHLEYNDSVKVPDMGVRNSHDVHPELMGEFYIKYHHKVIKCPVYHIKYPLNPEYKTFSGYGSYYAWSNTLWREYIPVKIKGLYKEERKYIQHHWESKVVTKFNIKEQILEAEVIRKDIGYGELQPYVRRIDVRD